MFVCRGWQGSMSVAEISEQLNLTSIKDHGWHIQVSGYSSTQEFLVFMWHTSPQNSLTADVTFWTPEMDRAWSWVANFGVSSHNFGEVAVIQIFPIFPKLWREFRMGKPCWMTYSIHFCSQKSDIFYLRRPELKVQNAVVFCNTLCGFYLKNTIVA